ncbi:MAG: S-layer homology domain-containing protein, partial [Oscillospiraceae bacterium]|nr:S-layer homology domain-containing protein [Oscillospiraceae bacterium]
LENEEIIGSTDYERVTLAVTALGLDAEKFNGRDLTEIYKTYNGRLAANGKTYALLSLNSKPYSGDADLYVQALIEEAHDGGGWSLRPGGDVDIDVTAMAIQALAPYYEYEPRVREAVDSGLCHIKSEQDEETGGFVGIEGLVSTCSTAQVISMLTALNIDPSGDEWTTDGGRSPMDAMLDHYNSESGYFGEFDDYVPDMMATEQAAYALAAYHRFLCGDASLYDMSDIDIRPYEKKEDNGSYWGDEDYDLGDYPEEWFYENEFSPIEDDTAFFIHKTDVRSPGKTFADIKGYIYQYAIEALAERNIIDGKSEAVFEPDSTMTRAEFAAIVTRGLGLPLKGTAIFTDVTENDWYFDYVNAAYSYGIIKGVSVDVFDPGGTVTREEAATMLVRAAKLCGMDTEIPVFGARNILAGFADYVKASDWAISSLAFCYDKGVLSDKVMEIQPKEAVTRAEIADMLYNMLSLAKLL